MKSPFLISDGEQPSWRSAALVRDLALFCGDFGRAPTPAEFGQIVAAHFGNPRHLDVPTSNEICFALAHPSEVSGREFGPDDLELFLDLSEFAFHCFPNSHNSTC